MLRFFAILFGAGIMALAAGFIYLGASPPKPQVRLVHIVLPNDRFGTN